VSASLFALDHFIEDGFELWRYVGTHWVWRKVDQNYYRTRYRIARGNRYAECAIATPYDGDPWAMQAALRRLEAAL
jgi:hypothetical protein